MTRPKIVFFDIDDTLFDKNKSLPDSTVEAISELQRRGVITAIATGRTPVMFAELRKQLNIHTYVSINGAYVVDHDEPVYTNPLPEQPLRALAAQARKVGWSFAYESADTIKMDRYIDEKARLSMDSLQLPMPFPETDEHFLDHHDVYQGLLFYSEKDDAHFLETPPCNIFRYVRWHEFGVDVLPSTGSKATGIAQLLNTLNISTREACAFGDGNNDIEMLSFVGTGIAMGNAVDAAKQSADFVTTSVHEDGIYHGLKQIGLL
ncbi:Cof-type HAD-IIB family hydrolase [Sporolactobacillus sp. CPB3-1]|uniref:Cof-type HAD-IIB family hydrolase n=1 Tax=Sporolactobacillus mangiferae TaxID=2940498 RepID=A0ABT0M8N2_9BACL|nr:Cof-type HAD-IIB family hydrolase [Sporolactobacillus mangiferae]MCL1630983.1 Cof-type HAD-IIB family hydrolase [Sporolactobacillus mangiferae]